MAKRVFISEVSQAIEDYFHRIGITKVDAARMLEITPQAVSQQLRLPFGKNSSSKWANTFGFNRSFLLSGEGELLNKPDLSQSAQREYDKAERALAQIEEDRMERNAIYVEDPMREEIEKEIESFRKKDIDQFISESNWDTTKDYNLALEIAEISREQKNYLINENDYLEEKRAALELENKKLFIENAELKRQLKSQ